MYRPPSKRRQLIQRIFVYSFMTVGAALLVTLLVFIMLGYRFNQASNTIQQGGLVQLNTRPTGARVTIGSAVLANQTPTKITVNPGDYLVTMQKDGYRDWQKTTPVQAGVPLWLTYAWLLPTNITTEGLLEMPTVKQAIASTDDEFFAVSQPSKPRELTIIDVRGDTPRQRTITLPSSLFADSADEPQLIAWSADDDKLLARTGSGTKRQWLIIDVSNASRSVNLNERYDISPQEVLFEDDASDQLVVRSTGDDVYSVNISESSIDTAFVKNATDISMLNDDTVLFVKKIDAKHVGVGYHTLGRNVSKELTRYTTKQTVRAVATTYFGETYLALNLGSELSIYIIDSLPPSTSSTSLSLRSFADVRLAEEPRGLTILSGGRMVVADHARGFATYDLELQQYHKITLGRANMSRVKWFDQHHGYFTKNGQLQLLESDGTNQQSIGVSSEFEVARPNLDSPYLYSFTKTKNEYNLQRSRIILE